VARHPEERLDGLLEKRRYSKLLDFILAQGPILAILVAASHSDGAVLPVQHLQLLRQGAALRGAALRGGCAVVALRRLFEAVRAGHGICFNLSLSLYIYI